VHFNDLLRDLPGELRRIMRFLDIECADQTLADVAQAVTFATMKQNADHLLPRAATAWKGVAQTCVFQGTNGRWQEVLSPEELALHRQTVARVLPHDCAAKLEHGRAALIELSLV
jgi:aryl sulfotransferase